MNNQNFIYYAQAIDRFDDLLEGLSTSDQYRALTIKNIQRKKVFVCGRSLLSTVLFQRLNQTEYQLSYNRLGKPILKNLQGWSFNLSHSGDDICLVLSQGLCGIDCEKIKQRNITRFNDYFSQEEVKQLSLSKTPLVDFYKFWTKKESLVKCLGYSIFSEIDPKEMSASQIETATFQFKHLVLSVSLSQGGLKRSCFSYHQF